MAAILTDTNSGITVEEGKKLGIYVIPMPVIIDEESFLEGIDINHEKLYEAMRRGRDISTSQPSPGVLMDMWDSILKDGHEEIVYIPMSSGLSNSCHNAVRLAEDYEGKVQVVDNHRISFSLRESVLDAKHLADQGCTALDIRERLERHAYDGSIYITVDSLDYLKKGGRITPAAAALATVIKLKPVLTIQGDKLDSYAKVRGMRHAEQKMIEAMETDLRERFSHIPARQLQLATAGTLEKPEDAERWRRMVQDAFPGHEVYYIPLSCSIACHTGINAAGIGVARIEER